jgi:heme exporter protein A
VSAAAPRAAAESVPAATLAVENLTHRYDRRTALHGLNVVLAAPACLAVTGPNGSGKSTLLRILAGLLRPTAGSVVLELEGLPVPAAERARRVGYAGPDLTFYPELSAAENLSFAAEARGLTTPSRRAAAALEQVGLSPRGNDRVAALSSGMVQRLRMASALLHDPAVLLLDEPASHLDDEGRAWLWALLADRSRNDLVVVATNDERDMRHAVPTIALGASAARRGPSAERGA